MGMYFNPGNSGFAEKLNTDYIDKTELISVINETIDTNNKLTCVSRPRRFGKSYAAQMLCAYYDRSCDSHRLFSGYKISKDENYETFINNYNVIYLDMTNILGKIDAEGLIGFIEKNVAEEIIQLRERLGRFNNSYELLFLESLSRAQVAEITKYVTVGDTANSSAHS